MTKPTIGRIVHYVSRGSADGVYPPVHVPFIVTAVEEIDHENEEVFMLTLDNEVEGPIEAFVSGWTFNNRGQRYEEGVPFMGDQVGVATCHWPERED